MNLAQQQVVKNVLIVLVLIQISNAATVGRCEGTLEWNIGNNPVKIQLSDYAGCRVQLTTDEQRIIALHREDGPISEIYNLVSILDGTNEIDLKNAPFNASHLNVNYDKTVYTSRNSAILEISPLASNFNLRIEKAVDCPINIGSETFCYRAVDDVSCYCAVYTKRNWDNQKTFCINNGYQLLTVQNRDEEIGIWNVWGTSASYWMSLVKTSDVWTWTSSNTPVSPGYSNWYSSYPTCDSYLCGILQNNQGWRNVPCSNSYDGICEKHP